MTTATSNQLAHDPDDPEDPRARWPPHPRRAATGLREVFGGGLWSKTWTWIGVAFLGVVAAAAVWILLLGPASRGWPGPGEFAILTSLALIEGLMIRQLVTARRWRRQAEAVERFGLEQGHLACCPHCGGHPFGTTPCCSRFPRGWSWRELHAFWHELASNAGRDQARLLNAWSRPRGEHLASLRHPRGGWRASAWHRWGLARLGIGLIATGAAGFLLWPITMRSPVMGLVFLGLMLLPAIFSVARSIRVLRATRPTQAASEPQCRTCGYRLHTPWPTRCSECGASLDAWNAVSFVPDFEGEGGDAGGNAVALERRRREAEGS